MTCRCDVLITARCRGDGVSLGQRGMLCRCSTLVFGSVPAHHRPPRYYLLFSNCSPTSCPPVSRRRTPWLTAVGCGYKACALALNSPGVEGEFLLPASRGRATPFEMLRHSLASSCRRLKDLAAFKARSNGNLGINP